MKILKTSKYREKFDKKVVTFCDSCQETNPIFECPYCDMYIKGKCRECHMEIVHGQIENSNIESFRNDSFRHLEPRMRSKMKS